MLEKQQQLYQRICTYELNDPSHEIGFLGHLIRAKDGQEERDRFHDLYPGTIRSYRQHFGHDLQMQCGRIRRPFKPWRGWRSWLRWRWSIQMGGLLIGLGMTLSALASAAARASSLLVVGACYA